MSNPTSGIEDVKVFSKSDILIGLYLNDFPDTVGISRENLNVNSPN